jgi:glycosyltransferase involved in cell wall biosynthesis
LEAFAVGTPVVATNIPGTNEIAINNQTALTVKPGDVSGLVDAIKKMRENPKLAKKLVFSGARLVTEQFNWTFNIEALGKILIV